MKASELDRSKVLEHAQITALWSTATTDEEGNMGENLDENYDASDFSEEAVESLVSLIDQFFDMAGELLDNYPATEEQLGHDLILTMNRHGAGFWDRGYGELGDKLTQICHSLGSYEPYVGDDNKIHAE